MSEQTMKILKMLEEGKITPDEASDLLSRVEALEQKAAKPTGESNSESHFTGPRHFEMPDFGQMNIPPIPDVHRIVGEALRDAFGQGFHHPRHPAGPRHKHGAPSHGNASFAGAKLEHTDLTEAKLDSKTRLEGADLRFSSFVDADLRGANLQGADLSYSDFTDANLRDADLQGAQLHHGAYTDADFSGSNLRRADLSLSDLTDACFKNVNHPDLTLRGMQMVGVKYEAVDDVDPRSDDDTAETGSSERLNDTATDHGHDRHTREREEAPSTDSSTA
jgi:hypothetical protein